MLDNFLYAEKTEENVLLATMESAEIKLDRLLNTYCLMEENFKVSLREAELKCFEESGDMDDLEQYYTEAQEKANEQEKGILGRIWDAIVKFAKRIKEFFFGKKSSVKPEDEVEAPKGFIGAVKKGCKFIKTLGSNIIGWISKHKGAILAGGAAVGAIAIFLNKDKLKEKLKSKDKEKVKGKDIQETLKECGEAAEVVGEAAQKQSEKPATSSSGGGKKEETKKESEVDAETPKTLKSILSGIQYTGKAVESLATGANIASTKANLTGAKNNNSSLGTSVNTKNGTKGKHGTFDQNGIEWIDTDAEKPKNEKNEKKAEKKEEKKDKTKGDTNTSTNTDDDTKSKKYWDHGEYSFSTTYDSPSLFLRLINHIKPKNPNIKHSVLCDEFKNKFVVNDDINGTTIEIASWINKNLDIPKELSIYINRQKI